MMMMVVVVVVVVVVRIREEKEEDDDDDDYYYDDDCDDDDDDDCDYDNDYNDDDDNHNDDVSDDNNDNDDDDDAGKRHRTRQVVTEPGPGGQSCPHLTETQTCQGAPCFKWHVTYGACEATPSGGCGQGTRQRFAVCVNREGRKVKSRHCWEQHEDNRPWEECYVPCPEDCVLSGWGEWRGCPRACLLHPSPAVRVRTRQILAFGATGRTRQILAFGATGSVSKTCPTQSALRESQPCPPPPDCGTYIWKTSDWTPCATTDPNAPCKAGTQSRSVSCYTSAGVSVDDEKCEAKVKPDTVRACDVPCAVDCVVTLWSEWSDCGTNCRPFTARQLLPKQNRRRVVIRYAQHGGSLCPRDLREERQCLHLPVCQTFHWHVTPWSSCILPPAPPVCGNGLRARNVTCRHANSTEAKMSLCLEHLSALPHQVEVCWVTCSSDCQLSQWEPWGACVQSCHGKRFRWRKLLGESRKKAECRDLSRYPLDQPENCVCAQPAPVVIGDWSHCIIEGAYDMGREQAARLLLTRRRHQPAPHLPAPPPSSSSPPAPGQVYCGSGVRYKVISCQSSDSDMESAQRCSLAEYKKEACQVTCPVDCQLTGWSPWSACSVTCGSGLQKRSRTIGNLPRHGGRDCPLLNDLARETQSRVCRTVCDHYQWRYEDWGPCVPRDQSLCGPGSQSRHVGCYAVREGQAGGREAEGSQCEWSEKPGNEQDCFLACPSHCVVSPWSQWSPCKQPCDSLQTQTRTRTVLREATPIASHNCAMALRDVKVCIRGDNCHEFRWELSDWTSCLVRGGSDVCGAGRKERFARCTDHDGKTVHDWKCVERSGPVAEALVVSCEIPCDQDCLRSDWSAWTTCSKSCGLGVTTRQRSVVQGAVGYGRKCGERREEWRPCFLRGCYHWNVTHWSPCKTQTGVCGSGEQRRGVSCQGQDGRAANFTLCPHDTQKLVLKTKRPCHVPCPGECRLSEWSPWSACFIGCQDFQQGFRRGVKARSRGVLANPALGNPPCDEVLWEEEDCLAERCLSFFWSSSTWGSRHTRPVLCKRSDGLVVEAMWTLFLLHLVSFLWYQPAPCLQQLYPSFFSPALSHPLHYSSPPPPAPVPSVYPLRHYPPPLPSPPSSNLPMRYSRDQLLEIQPSTPNFELVNRLRELRLGVGLPRKRGCRGGRKKLRSIQVVPSRNLHPLMVPPFLQPHPDLQSAVGNAPLSSKHPTHLPTTDCLLSITPLMGGQPSDAPALSPPSPIQQGGQSSNAPALSPPSPLPQGSQPIALALSPSSPLPQDGQPSDAPGLSPSSSTLLLCPSDSTLSICHLNSQSAVKTVRMLNTPLSLNPPQNLEYTLNTPQDLGYTLNTPQDLGYTLNTPQNLEYTLNTPQDLEYTLNTPQDLEYTLNTPQDRGYTLNTPQDVGYTLNTPQDLEYTLNTPQDLAYTLNTPQDLGYTLNTPQDLEYTLNTPQDLGSSLNKPTGLEQTLNTPETSPWEVKTARHHQ
ncbi:hypothetical protein ACOMHN_063746 [Nucella lapillus]